MEYLLWKNRDRILKKIEDHEVRIRELERR